ncbi:hypothetical protein AURDEDRAFT_122325 [Auricularia subglabra TFB-10046 SS5]|nr:hypothetical protein AURDEDRAFT_122325 [Auricularia subglabra TFB-10046 SS5]
MSSNSSCLISADPDVAGIGVRIAVYLQALLPLISIAFVPHSSISNADAALIEQYCERGNDSLAMLSFTSAALLVVSFIKHAMRSLSPYHAIVVLNLTWIILISSCCRAAIMYHLQKHGIPGSFAQRLGETVKARIRGRGSVEGQNLHGIVLGTSNSHFSKFSLHASALCWHLLVSGVLGWLLFGDIEGFARGRECPDETVLWMGTSFVRITQPIPRRFWKATYMAALLSPLSLPIFCFLTCFLAYLVSNALLALIHAVVAKVDMLYRAQSGNQTNAATDPEQSRHPSSALPLRAFEVLTVALLALLIISTEKTVAGNPVGENDEGEWGFGQILSLILTASPIYDAVEDLRMGLEIWSASRRIARLSRLSKLLKPRRVTFRDRAFMVPPIEDGSGTDSASKLLVIHSSAISDVPAQRIAAQNAIIIEPLAMAPGNELHSNQTGLFEESQIAALKQMVADARSLCKGVKVGVQLRHSALMPRTDTRQESPGKGSSESPVRPRPPVSADFASPARNTLSLSTGGSGASRDSSFGRVHTYSFQGVKAAFSSAVKRLRDIELDFIEILTTDGFVFEPACSPASLPSPETHGIEVRERVSITQEVLEAVRQERSDVVLSVHVECGQKKWEDEDSKNLAKLLSAAKVDMVTVSSDGICPLTCPVAQIRPPLAHMIGEHPMPGPLAVPAATIDGPVTDVAKMV